jgi:hypothetical protein
MMLPNIAFTGKFGSGKSTAANYLVRVHGYVKVSFADRLKEIATKACRMVGKDRELLQKLGVMIREDEPDYWVKAAVKKVREINERYGPVVIDDLRFPNELNACLAHDFKVFRVDRNREARLATFGMDPNVISELETHESETALDSVLLPSVDSNCDIQAFEENIKTMLALEAGVRYSL